jgi:predicted methyltransferase
MRLSPALPLLLIGLAVMPSHLSAESAAIQKAELAAAVSAPTRTATNVARDKYRKPAETLTFFGIRPSDNVVEVWPGGGWYTEILAPYLRAKGKLIVVAPPGKPSEGIAKKLDADAQTYGKVVRANFPTLLGGVGVAPNSVDAVLTFRNVHNWRMGYLTADKADYSEAAFRELYTMLKPGGVLGIEDHRLPESADAARELSSGYLKVSTVRALAEKSGFRFVGSSEVNANPRDTKDYPQGVWALPPTYAEKDVDRDRYSAIGESDRMTLKFIKPAR